MRDSYENSWKEILGACRTVLFMAGYGCSPADEKYLIKIIGEEMDSGAIIKNNVSKIESSIRTMCNDKCLAIIKSKIVCVDDKYDPPTDQ